jgi:hypothetical protein
MFKIEMLPAEYGDCLWIEYGDSRRPSRILVDGGTISTGKRLRERIEALPEDDRRFDLVIVTHIDSDHIDGIVKMFQELPEGLEFAHFWFNAYDHTRPEGFLGAKQGEYLTVELLALEDSAGSKFWNEAFRRRAAMLPDEGEPLSVDLDGGMRVTVLGPTSRGLRELRKNWEQVMKEAQMKAGDVDGALEALRDDRRFRAGWLGKPNVERLAAADFDEDQSPANGSSIVVLLEYGEKKVLLAGDAHPSDIVAALARLPGQSGKRLRLDAFKVPHHGSKHNSSNELYEAMDCRRFLISSNGKKFGHPDQEGIARILQNPRRAPELFFNYRSDLNKMWDSETLRSDHDYAAHYPEADEGGLVLTL